MDNSRTVTLDRVCTCPECGHQYVDRVGLVVSLAGSVAPGGDSNAEAEESAESSARHQRWIRAVMEVAAGGPRAATRARFCEDAKRIMEELAGFPLRFAGQGAAWSILHPSGGPRSILRLEAGGHQSRLGFRFSEEEVRQAADGLKVRAMRTGSKWVFVYLPTAEAVRQLAPLVRRAVLAP